MSLRGQAEAISLFYEIAARPSSARNDPQEGVTSIESRNSIQTYLKFFYSGFPFPDSYLRGQVSRE
jgi:hypothetical protein